MPIVEIPGGNYLIDGRVVSASPTQTVSHTQGAVVAPILADIIDGLDEEEWLPTGDPRSLSRITGAATLAGFAIGAGAPEGYLRWANPARDFGWIASDDTVALMDAQTCFAFGQLAASVESGIIFSAAVIRAMQPVPRDYAEDEWW